MPTPRMVRVSTLRSQDGKIEASVDVSHSESKNGGRVSGSASHTSIPSIHKAIADSFGQKDFFKTVSDKNK